MFGSFDDALIGRIIGEPYVVTFARRGLSIDEIVMRSESGHELTLRAQGTTDAARWIDCLSAAQEKTVKGYLYVSRKKGWKRRWAVYQIETGALSLFQYKSDYRAQARSASRRVTDATDVTDVTGRTAV